jgi:hypothetical protein
LTRQRLEDDLTVAQSIQAAIAKLHLHKNRSLTVGLIDRRLIALGITGLAHLNATSNLQWPYYPNDPTTSPMDRLGPAKRSSGRNEPAGVSSFRVPLRWSIAMPRTGWSPSTVPYGADQTVYLVIDRFKNGTVYRETEIERTDLEAIINDFMTGQFNDPVRVVAFNTLEHWADDVSKGVAQEIQTRCDIAGEPVPEHIEDFVDTYTGPTRQLSLRL